MGKSRACRTLLLTSASEKRLKRFIFPGSPKPGALFPPGGGRPQGIVNCMAAKCPTPIDMALHGHFMASSSMHFRWFPIFEIFRSAGIVTIP